MALKRFGRMKARGCNETSRRKSKLTYHHEQPLLHPSPETALLAVREDVRRIAKVVSVLSNPAQRGDRETGLTEGLVALKE